MKTCTACRRALPRSGFYETRSRGKPYASARCRPCHNKATAARHTIRAHADPAYRMRRLLHEIRKRDPQADIDVAWLIAKWEAGRCEVTGIPFDTGTGDIHARPWGFSVDRKNQQLGYTRDNCVAAVWAYNRAKGTGTADDVVRLAKAILSPETK